MELESNVFFALVIVAGLITGIMASGMVDGEEAGKCSKIEQDIRSSQNFTGSVSCYPPGMMDVNISEEIDNRTELECVCKKVNNGNVQIFPITVAR